MKNSFKLNGIVLFIALIATILIYNCGSDDTVTNTNTGPDAGSISGTITFADTNNPHCVPTCGFFELAAFANWPPTGAPSAFVTLTPTKANNKYTATYKLVGLTSGGSYVLVAAFTELPYHAGGNFILGVHGCDNNEACYLGPGVKRDTLPSNQGLAGIDFKCFLDTTSSHVRF